MSQSKEEVVEVCWHCGRAWGVGSIGRKVGRRPVIIYVSEWMHWLESGDPPEFLGVDLFGEPHLPASRSPIEAAYRRGVGQSLDWAAEVPLMPSQLRQAAATAKRLREDTHLAYPDFLEELERQM